MRSVLIVLFGILILGCKKKSTPKSPDAAILVFPEKSSECTTGSDVTENTSKVEFRWSASDNTESYQLKVKNLTTNSSQTFNTEALTQTVTIAKGEPFEWFVRSLNTDVDETATSETWRFYNAGQVESYVPFPAEGVNPLSGSSVFKSVNNEVTLKWFGNDLDNDIDSYEIYFSISNPPETLIESVASNRNSIDVSVVSGTTYYWSVVSIDREENKSESGIFIFKVL